MTGTDLEISCVNEQDVDVDLDEIEALARFILVDRRMPAGTELGVHLVDEETIAAYNKRFRGRAEPTDVLSLPVDDMPRGRKDAPERATPDEPPVVLGDVVICPAVAARLAPERTGELGAELRLLTAHGVLHLLAYDHAIDDEAAEMEALEDDLLTRFRQAAAEPTP